MNALLRGFITLALLLMLGFLSGCASSSFSPSTSKQYPAWGGKVAVLKQLPAAGKYTLIGIVRVQAPNLSSDERMYRQLKEKAAAQGANAVVPQAKIKTRLVSSGGKQRLLVAYALRVYR